MKRLFLHSDHNVGNKGMDEALLKMFSGKTIKLGYIPSQADPSREFFKIKSEWYSQFGISDIMYCDIDEEYNEATISELLSRDAIFLSGGNTYTFLNSIKKRNLISKLQGFVANGGVLIGLSAGAILMSETINIVSIDNDFDGDDNYVGLTNLDALGFNDFEFFPHFDESQEITYRLKEYSRYTGKVVYACNDGSGIIVNDYDIKCIGRVWKIVGENMRLVKNHTS